MADFVTTGVDDLMREIEMLAGIPDEVMEEMLRAEAGVVEAHQRRRLAELRMKEPTGQTVEAIGTGAVKRDREGRPCVYVYPRGKRRERDTRNAEVGFILEYGAPRRGIAPRQWMRLANAKAEREAAKAAEGIFKSWQEKRK